MIKNILITGGAGYIGSHVAEILIKNKKRVIILDNLSTGFKRLIIFDRYAHDLIIDPIRYRFNLPSKISNFILRLFPRPTFWIILNAPINVLEKRKKELPTKELKKQIRAYLNFAKQRKNSIVVNTNNSVQSSLSLIIKKINNFN